MEDRQIFEIDLKYTFDVAESEEIGKRLAAAEKEREDLEAEKKQVVSNLTAQIKEAQARIKQDSDKINQGYEIRKTPVYAQVDLEARVKRFFRADNDEMVKEEPIPKNYQAALYDHATDLPFDEEEESDEFAPMDNSEIEQAASEVKSKSKRGAKKKAEEV